MGKSPPGLIKGQKNAPATLENDLLFSSAFQRLPFEAEGNARGQLVNLGKFAFKNGAKVVVGLRSNKTAEFVDGSIKEVFEVGKGHI